MHRPRVRHHAARGSPGKYGTPASAPLLTIDSLFARIAQAQRHNARKIEVVFNPVLHYPKSIDILWESRITDSDTRIEVTAFHEWK